MYTIAWGYLLNSGDINSVWALFGVSDSSSASIGLAIGRNHLPLRGLWYITHLLVPLICLCVTVNYAVTG